MAERKSRNFWTKDAVIASAIKHQSISEWRKESAGAYAKAYEMGWLEESVAHMKNTHQNWTYEKVEAEATKYGSLSEWARNGKGSYSKAQKMGWLDQLSALFKRKIHPNGYWTKERVLADAKKYQSRSDWRKKALELQQWLIETAGMKRLQTI